MFAFYCMGTYVFNITKWCIYIFSFKLFSHFSSEFSREVDLA